MGILEPWLHRPNQADVQAARRCAADGDAAPADSWVPTGAPRHQCDTYAALIDSGALLIIGGAGGHTELFLHFTDCFSVRVMKARLVSSPEQ